MLEALNVTAVSQFSLLSASTHQKKVFVKVSTDLLKMLQIAFALSLDFYFSKQKGNV